MPVWLLVLMGVAYVAIGPFFTRPEETVGGGIVGVLAAHRNNHPLRVVPWAVVFTFMLVDLWKKPRPAAGFPSR